MGFLFKKEDPKKLLEGLDRAQAILEDRYKKKQVNDEFYFKQMAEFNKQREKYQKQVKE